MKTCGYLSDTIMSEIKDSTRAERIAKYKEERRKQLAAQFVSLNVPTTTSSANNTPTSNHKYRYKETSSSSGSEAPRTTRTSRLRAAAVQQDIIASSPTKYDIRDVSIHIIILIIQSLSIWSSHSTF